MSYLSLSLADLLRKNSSSKASKVCNHVITHPLLNTHNLKDKRNSFCPTKTYCSVISKICWLFVAKVNIAVSWLLIYIHLYIYIYTRELSVYIWYICKYIISNISPISFDSMSSCWLKFLCVLTLHILLKTYWCFL